MARLHACSTLFPYTTLFRSRVSRIVVGEVLRLHHDDEVHGGAAQPAEAPAVRLRHRAPGVGLRRPAAQPRGGPDQRGLDRKSTRLNSSHSQISYAVFCLKKK